MSALYRNYRPQKFSEILGQNHLKVTLQNEIATNTLAHAYLFCGPRAVGKTSMARILAQSINCENRKDGESEPCGECQACSSIKLGKALDVMEIDAASNTGVDNVRDNIIASVRLAPSYLKTKVFIIDEVHMLSINAFNALLKTLEEPPKHIVFILCTTEAHKVPLTIISRCQRFDFRRISSQEIVKKLKIIAQAEKIEVETAVLENIAKQSGGHLRDAESLFGQVLALGEKKISAETAELVLPRHNQHEALDIIDALSRQDAATAISIINTLADNGINFKNFLEDILFLLRKIMLQNLQPGLAEKLSLDLGEQLEIKITKAAKDCSLSETLRMLKKFLELARIGLNNINQLAIEIAVVELCLPTAKNNDPVTSGSKPLTVSPKISVKEISDDKKENKEIIKNLALDLTQEEVLTRWPEVLVKIKKHNHSLSFVLQNCLPSALKSGIMTLHFKYKFHRDRIISAAIKSLTEDTLSEVYNAKVQIDAILDEKLELSDNKQEEANIDKSELKSLESNQELPKNSAALGSLLANFGGETL